MFLTEVALALKFMKVFNNVRTLSTTPGMLRHWMWWNLGLIGIQPRLSLPSSEKISGFRNFSEFWSARAMIPSGDELAFMNRFVGKSGVLLDVGANLGCFSLTLARIRPDCIVHSFEPSPETFIRLKANMARNQKSNVKIHQLALGKEIGHLQFVNDQSSPGTNHLVAQTEVIAGSTIEVEVSTIDQFLETDGAPDVAFLKIDVEGFEADVLRGAAHTLMNRQCQAGLIELCPGNLRQVGSSVEDLLECVEQVGWRLHFLNADGSPGSIVSLQNTRTVSLANVAMLPVNAG
jgi:FkbM family methyltransferase